MKTERRAAKPAVRVIAGILGLALLGGGAYAWWRMQTPAPAAEPTPVAAAADAEPAGPRTRIVRVEPANVRVVEDLRLTTAELLDDNFALFDNSQLVLTEPRRVEDEIGRARLFAEVVNRSDQYIAVSPKLSVAVYDGAEPLNLRLETALPAQLYPGERIPVQFVGRDFARFTEIKTDWKPARRAPLPGTRPALEVSVDKTEAGIGTGTLNFTYRYRYKYVTVQGRVRNTGEATVEQVRIWLALYDAQDRLTGTRSDTLRLPRLAPGESAPFEYDVKQLGANFTRVELLYDVSAR
ncbi:FxLYD domain-containing protein [Pseudomonadota bacterium AL_CKDN230030165-1A_HGKHYDSX7]